MTHEKAWGIDNRPLLLSPLTEGDGGRCCWTRCDVSKDYRFTTR